MKTATMLLLGAALLAGCNQRGDAGWSGYADGDYVYVAAPIAGQLSALNVIAGQQVAKGKPLFALDDEAEKAAREEANARLSAASFQAADTEKGKREPEVSVNQAQLAQARAQADLARNDLTRKRELLAKGFIAQAQVDEAEHTPPVIYSNEQRAKLVFLVEAKPAPADAPKLRPGQPVSVTSGK
jgi:HlyD family secretion protein